MQLISEYLEKAIEQLSKLPGTGRKSAQRIAIHLLKQNEQYAQNLTQAIIDLTTKVSRCSICGSISDSDPCSICSSSKRETSTLCVVEEFNDVYLIERTNEFKGRYHVLGGIISPMDNVGPDQLRIKELLGRIREESIQEVILALNPDAEGEATSYYLNKLLVPYEIQVTRIAYGIPMGTELEYIDEVTLGRAFSSRTLL
ncbi:MAG: recombination protein RecR [Balneola sp.]|nr:recombination protein RecR [Balneola sp.]